MTEQVMAAIDGSRFSTGVCDHAAWACQALGAPLTFLHVVGSRSQTAEADLSGHIGLGSREHLLEELAALDERRARLARERGRHMLEAARLRAGEHGVTNAGCRQRNGQLVEALAELEPDIRLLVLGKRGETAHQASEHLGSNLERVVRSLRRPILVVPASFTRPRRVMLAFDGSETTRKGVEMIARSPLFQGIACHVVTVGAETGDNRARLDWALTTLREAGLEAEGAIRTGEVEETLRAYQERRDVDMLVMGAYGHSRIRHLLVGSTTTAMMRGVDVPVLLLR